MDVEKTILTEIAQDRANERRLDDTELAFQKRKDLRYWVSRRWPEIQRILRTAMIISTL